MEINFDKLVKFLDHWQSLVGAIIGAGAPLVIWLIIQKIENKNKHKQNILLIHKSVASNINTLIDNYNTLKKFLEINFKNTLKNIDAHNAKGIYSFAYTYIPQFSSEGVNIDLFSLSSESGFVDNNLHIIGRISQEFPIIMQDLRNQLNDTIQLHKEICFNKSNSASVQNLQYKDNLKEFEKVVRTDMLEKNFTTYLKVLITVLVATSIIYKKGLFRWKIKFSASFKYFKNLQEFKNFNSIDNTFERIEKYLKNDFDAKYKEIQAKLN